MPFGISRDWSLGETSFVHSQVSLYLEWNSTASGSNPGNLLILKILVQTSENNFTHNSCQKLYTSIHNTNGYLRKKVCKVFGMNCVTFFACLNQDLQITKIRVWGIMILFKS